MTKPPITLRFAPGEEPHGYGQGHFALHLDRSISTEDYGQTCMVILAGTELLDFLLAMFAGQKKKFLRYKPVEATRLSVSLEREGEMLKVTDEKGPLGVIKGETLIAATLRETEALARLCAPDPSNGGLQDLEYMRANVVRAFPNLFLS
jgi:hypothetical protein